jgi:NAD(P)-dependent dehydrogenase (short-subunit alcohol dehydrogenase family)
MFDINVKSTFFLIKECYQMLRKSKKMGGAANVIINSSLSARHGSPIMGVYAITKGVLENLTIGLSKEFLRDGIRVNAVSPGTIKTDIIDDIVDSMPKIMIGEPEDIASVVALICAKHDGHFMNGEIFHVNGGWGRM